LLRHETLEGIHQGLTLKSLPKGHEASQKDNRVNDSSQVKVA